MLEFTTLFPASRLQCPRLDGERVRGERAPHAELHVCRFRGTVTDLQASPVRVYQGEGIGVFTSEIQFPNEKDIYFAETVLQWFTKGGFDRLIVIDGVISNDLGIKEEGELWGVSSNKKGREQLENAGIRGIQQGIVSGIAGYLIAEGERRGLDVTALLAECNPMYPDARAALIAVEGVSELLDKEIPIQDLLDDARNIEERVREAFNRAQKTALPAPNEEDDDDDEVQMIF